MSEKVEGIVSSHKFKEREIKMQDIHSAKMVNLFNKYVEKGLSHKEAFDLVSEMYKFTASWYIDEMNLKELPSLRTKESEGFEHLGDSDSKTGDITLNDNFLLALKEKPDLSGKVLSNNKSISEINKEYALFELLDTIAHEMTHVSQMFMNQKYKELSDDDKIKYAQKVEKLTKGLEKSIKELSDDDKSKYVEKTEKILKAHRSLESYEKPIVAMGKFVLPYQKDYRDDVDVEEMEYYAEYGLYLASAHEVHARECGAQLRNHLISCLLNNKNLSSNSRTYILNNMPYMVQPFGRDYALNDKQRKAFDDKGYKDNIEITALNWAEDIKDLILKFDEKTMINIAADAERKISDSTDEFAEIDDSTMDLMFSDSEKNSYHYMNEHDKRLKRASIYHDIYSRAIEYFLKDKTLEQKQALLKNAMFHGMSQYGNKILDSIKSDKEFENKKGEIQKEIFNYLSSGSVSSNDVDDEKSKLTKKSYMLNYFKILSDEQCVSVLKNTIGQDKLLFAEAFQGKNCLKLSNEQKTTLLNDVKQSLLRVPQKTNLIDELKPSGFRRRLLESETNIENFERRNISYEELYGTRQLIEDARDNGDYESADEMSEELFAGEKYRDNLIYMPSSESARVIDQSMLKKNKERQIEGENISE